MLNVKSQPNTTPGYDVLNGLTVAVVNIIKESSSLYASEDKCSQLYDISRPQWAVYIYS